jgi:hypothetical protein
VTTEISEVHVELVCRIGQGPATCAFLLMDPGVGMICAKGTGGVEAEIRRRLAAGTMGAKGDNCPGWGLHLVPNEPVL